MPWRAPSSNDGGETTTRCGRTRPTAASRPRPWRAGLRATACAIPTSSAGRLLPTSRQKRHEEHGFSSCVRDQRGAGQSFHNLQCASSLDIRGKSCTRGRRLRPHQKNIWQFSISKLRLRNGSTKTNRIPLPQSKWQHCSCLTTRTARLVSVRDA